MKSYLSATITGSEVDLWIYGAGFSINAAIAAHAPSWLTIGCALWLGFIYFSNLYSWDYQRRHNNEQGEE